MSLGRATASPNRLQQPRQLQRRGSEARHQQSSPPPHGVTTAAEVLDLQRSAGNAAVARRLRPPTAASAVPVQRHSSWEHKMLGDISPDDLEIIGAAKNLGAGGQAATDLRDPTGNVVGQKMLRASGGPHAGQVITTADVMHTLMQEIDRIKFFRDQPPLAGESRAAYALRLQNLDAARQGLGPGAIAAANQWQVRLVEIPGTAESGPLIITYGELNTLADFYGSSTEMREAEPRNRYRLMQGIRQQSLFNLMDIYDKVAGGSNFSSKLNPSRIGEGFDDAIGSTGRGLVGPLAGGAFGEVRLMMGDKKATGGRKEQDYSAGLGRNACHFAPESWHSWAGYHNTARGWATTAWRHRQQMAQAANLAHHAATADEVLRLTDRINLFRKSAEVEENNALLENGFGDHYLQDSYAAGHLINKTEIMLRFVEYMDTKPWKVDWTRNPNWRRIQAIAYKQPGVHQEAGRYDTTQVGSGAIGPKDPQSVENLGGSWQDRFTAIGLKVPRSVTPGSQAWELTVWWQRRAMKKLASRKLRLAQVPTSLMGTDVAWQCFFELERDGVARKVSGKGRKATYMIRDDYVPKNATAFNAAVNAYNTSAGLAPAARKQAGQAYEDMAGKVTYKAYHEFLNNTMLQAGSNILHDKYCKNGLVVRTASGDQLGRIYGDDAMVGKDSGKGVKYSAQTANMSREAIEEIMSTGATNTAVTDISERFPTDVQIPDHSGPWYSLADLAGKDFSVFCPDSLFAEAQASVKVRVGGIKGNSLAGAISKDVDVHAGAAF